VAVEGVGAAAVVVAVEEADGLAEACPGLVVALGPAEVAACPGQAAGSQGQAVAAALGPAAEYQRAVGRLHSVHLAEVAPRNCLPVDRAHRSAADDPKLAAGRRSCRVVAGQTSALGARNFPQEEDAPEVEADLRRFLQLALT
jgi:hypothetical protein